MWTSEKPTKPGDYLYRQNVLLDRVFVEITVDRYTNEALVLFTSGAMLAVDDLNGDWFAIPDPNSATLDDVIRRIERGIARAEGVLASPKPPFDATYVADAISRYRATVEMVESVRLILEDECKPSK